MTRVFIGVGSNIAPESNIKAAIRLLAEKARLVDISTFYRTPAEGRPEQPDYLNGVLEIETNLAPEDLKKDVLRRIECELGRRRGADKYAARPIDLDILIYGTLEAQSKDLSLPSEDIKTRSFVAIPLAEIAPDLIVPGTGAQARAFASCFSRASLTPDELTSELQREWVLPAAQTRMEKTR